MVSPVPATSLKAAAAREPTAKEAPIADGELLAGKTDGAIGAEIQARLRPSPRPPAPRCAPSAASRPRPAAGPGTWGRRHAHGGARPMRLRAAPLALAGLTGLACLNAWLLAAALETPVQLYPKR